MGATNLSDEYNLNIDALTCIKYGCSKPIRQITLGLLFGVRISFGVVTIVRRESLEI